MTIKQTLFTDWHFMRWLRLALGIFAAIQAIEMRDSLSGLIALFFLYQAVTNTGCCGASGCAVPIRKQNEVKEIDFEEIK